MGQKLYTSRVGGEQIIGQLQKTGKLSDGTPLHYAAGLYTYNYRGLKVVDHGGADAGYVADLMRFPAQHFSVATLCNLSSIEPTTINQRIADIYLANGLQPLPPDPIPFHPNADSLRSKAGTYLSKRGDAILRLQLRDNALWADSYFGPCFKLEPLSENRFAVPELLAEIDFSGADNAHLTWMNKREELESDKPHPFDRVAPFTPAAAQLRYFVGVYRGPELDVPYPMTLERNRLVLHPPKKGELALQPVALDLFVGEETRIRFTRDAHGQVSAFLLNTNRTRNLRFERASR